MRKVVLASLSVLIALSLPQISWAGPVLDQIKQTGTINAGTRKDAVPFGYVDKKGEWVGYSLDILELIRKQTEKKLGKPIKLKLIEATAGDRFDKINNRIIDIECASTTFTWERTKKVDFSVSYFADGTKILTNTKSGLESLESLAGRKIGVVPNSTNERAIKLQQPAAQLVFVKDQVEGLSKLEKGEIEAFAGDGIVLEGIRKNAKNPKNWAVVPSLPYQYESYACILPKDDSDWRNLVNYALLQYMEGVVSDQTKSVEIFDKWFGDEGVTPYPRDTINEYFQGIVNGYEWIPIIDY
ncbi:MAG: amino acid ABC transporter substrate-binding protein [Microcystaceae cyanobacterium]